MDVNISDEIAFITNLYNLGESSASLEFKKKTYKNLLKGVCKGKDTNTIALLNRIHDEYYEQYISNHY